MPLDFYKIKRRIPKSKDAPVELYPDFKVCRSKDLMIRGKSFYAVWDEEKGLWSTDEYDVQRLVDEDLYENAKYSDDGRDLYIKTMSDFSSNSWQMFRKYYMSLSDIYHQLDTTITFANTDVKKEDYVSKRLAYSLEEGSIEAYDKIMSELYDPEERRKLEWAIGAIISGDAKSIQKFVVLYGSAGAGKSTFLNIVQKLFEGYYTTFEAKELTSSSNAFSTEAFRSNPLVAIQHDGDLSRIEDNTKLNSIVSHEEMIINEKHKATYTAKLNCFLFMGTNKPVKITDAKSGLIRRLIDVHPSGRHIPIAEYNTLMSKIDFELGAIAAHCLDVYRELGKNYYNAYRPVAMMYKTDIFYNFVEDSFDVFKEQDGVSLKSAYALYKEYCDNSGTERKLPMYKFREELKNYFHDYHDRYRKDDKNIRSYFVGFDTTKFSAAKLKKDDNVPYSLVLDKTESLLDYVLSDEVAQYATEDGIPFYKWENVDTKLSDLDTHKEHYVKLPINHIVIDFDLKDEDGNKSLQRNLEAASQWPTTYAELSRGGNGVHLHYFYDGDVDKLNSLYDKDIEIKVFKGNSSLRRKLSKCNDIPIRTINSGLPLKEVKKVLNFNSVKSEKGLRDLINRNLRKEIHPGTKPSIDFIKKILDDAYADGLNYDISDMRPEILVFANNSTNQSEYCVKLVNQMKFKSEEPSDPMDFDEDDLIFFDIEVFPNLFLVNWKKAGEDQLVVRMINPSPQDIEELLRFKLVGFNNRRYDNHILYARLMGFNNEQLYNLSQRIIENSPNALFAEAYNLSYTDVYDFASAGNKKGLKKWEIELGIHHQELGLPWDQPVPEEKWVEVAEYCDNDVISTEAVFNHLAADFKARQILAELSGLTVNHSTNAHATKIIFGDDPKPQKEFVYTDLGEELFPGYKYRAGKSIYKGENPGEGGYVYAEPGIYTNVALLDVASMHPTSIEQLNLFGDRYTKKFSEIKQARIYIKHKEFDKAREMLDGKLAPYLDDESQAEDLADALKTVINSVYGLTSARFDNKFRDIRNKDNIVAKRGALFMIDLKEAVQNQGYTVAHIKTDSIKIPNADQKIIDFVMEFGKKYGYTFEHEATYSKMCLVNDAVYIAKVLSGKHAGEWVAVGAQFQQPYVFKTLFSHEPIEFYDLCETKNVKSALYLDMNDGLGENEHNYVFVGKTGSFCPIKEGCGGGILLREHEGKYYAATGTKGYRWMESEMVQELLKEDDIDYRYFDTLCDEAVNTISKYGSFDNFVKDLTDDEVAPWEEVVEVKGKE